MKIIYVAELLFLAVLWGGSFLFMRISSPVLGPIWLIELRVLIAGLALLPLLIYLNCWQDVRRYLVPLFIMGCLNTAVPFSLVAFGSLFLPAGFSSILNATIPLFGVIVAAFWQKEKLTGSRLVGFILGFVGVTILVGWKAIDGTHVFFLAVGAGLSASLMYACAASYAKKNLSGVPSLVTASVSLLSAAIFLIPILPFTIPKTPITPSILLAVFALALFSTALAYVLYFRLIQAIGSTKTLTVAYLIPLFAILFGAIFLGEPLTLSMLIGCGLILLGTAIANNLLQWKI
ncbi:EamA family transporter [Aphanothece hegewaldii CCALA 016]|uniref:EamA family transporter n=1 Tax=Aphanothece hegewaldii CCALA 016 TaxID=2107694 RepID=A0A2T1LV23_9CHRO|nr:DMT family transporter [Aphanothece hegewaldii]PSF35420.1 EamA family transporter [Aphanothece hegewaldii CCALA 016]